MTDKKPGAPAPGKIAIDPIVALNELGARTDAERAYFTNRVLLLSQEAHALRETVEAQKAEIERLTAGDKKAK